MRYLPLLYNGNKSNVYTLLERDTFVSFHQRNSRTLVMKVYRIYNGIAAERVGIFSLRPQGHNNTKNWSDFIILNVKTASSGLVNIRYLGRKT